MVFKGAWHMRGTNSPLYNMSVKTLIIDCRTNLEIIMRKSRKYFKGSCKKSIDI